MLPAISHLLLTCLRAQSSMLFTTATRPARDPLHYQKSINFQPCFQGGKNGNKLLPMPPKNNKNTSSNPQKTNSMESWILQYSQCENLELEDPSVEISTQRSLEKVTRKQARNRIDISSLGTQTTFKTMSPNRPPKINEHHVPDHLVSILLLLWSTRVVPRYQNSL